MSQGTFTIHPVSNGGVFYCSGIWGTCITRHGIVEALGDEDFGFTDDGTAEFLLKISRRGTGLDTSYSVLPKAKAPTKVEANAMETVKDLQVSALLIGGHPFIQAAAEFSTASTEEAEF